MTGTGEKARALFLALIMVVSVVGMTVAIGGSAVAVATDDTTLTKGDAQTVIDGSANQSLDRISIQDDIGGAMGGGESNIVLPDGVTVNESQSDVVAFTNSDTLDVTGVSVSADGNEITVTHDGNTEVDDVLRVRDVVVDVAPDTVAANANTLDLSAEIQAGSETYSDAFTVNKATLGGGGGSVDLGSTQQTVALGSVAVNELGTIGNQTTLTVYANESNGITFDESVDPTTVVSGTTGDIAVDSDNIEISATEITIPISNEATAAGDSIELADVSVNVTGDAEAFKLTAEAEAAESTGVFTVDNSGFGEVSITEPDTSVDFAASPDAISIAKNEQTLSENIVVDVGDTGEVGQDTNVTIKLNDSSGVSFAAVGDVTGADTADSSTTDDTDENNAFSGSLDDLVVNENNITVRVTGSELNADDEITFANVQVNTTEDSAGDYIPVAEIQADTDATVLDVSSDTNVQSVVEPSASFSDGDQEVYVDNDGIASVGLSQIDVTDNAEGTFNGIVADSSANATVSLPENTGVTFDKSSTPEDGVTTAVVNDNEIELELSDNGNFFIADGDSLYFNVTEDADEVV